MIPHTRKKAIKIMSFAIGMCGSVKPEKQAEAAFEELIKRYDLVKKEKAVTN